MGVYVTRDTLHDYVDVWPATVGIRKFHGCIIWGAAWCKGCWELSLYPKKYVRAEFLNKTECRKCYGFVPRAGTAWYVNSRGKRSKVDIDFSP